MTEEKSLQSSKKDYRGWWDQTYPLDLPPRRSKVRWWATPQQKLHATGNRHPVTYPRAITVCLQCYCWQSTPPCQPSSVEEGRVPCVANGKYSSLFSTVVVWLKTCGDITPAMTGSSKIQVEVIKKKLNPTATPSTDIDGGYIFQTHIVSTNLRPDTAWWELGQRTSDGGIDHPFWNVLLLPRGKNWTKIWSPQQRRMVSVQHSSLLRLDCRRFEIQLGSWNYNRQYPSLIGIPRY